MPDPNVLAFLPWTYVEEPMNIGPLRLLPYRIGELPGDLPHIKQADIDGVLDAYSNLPNKPISRATLLEYADWHAGMPVTDALPRKLFLTRDLIAFSALSKRKLFRGHSDYCNTHTYLLILQRFKPGETGTFAFTTRRRDGGTNQLWGSDEFAFHRPSHVDGHAKLALDETLLVHLLDLPETHRAYEAIAEFNAANTDSSDVPDHVEVVMCKSAFEWLLEIGTSSNELVNALESRLKSVKPEPCDGPLKEVWLKHWQHQSRPLLAWAKDFCAVRGTSAHGKSRSPSVWANHQHLAFISVFFPLLLKLVLADEKLMVLEPNDLEHLKRIEQYLMHDPFAYDWDGDESHPWSDISLYARISALI